MTSIEAQYKILRDRIDEVLFYKWDPLGMSYEPACRDEYSSYVDSVLALLTEGSSARKTIKQVTDYLIATWEVAMYRDADKDPDSVRLQS